MSKPKDPFRGLELELHRLASELQSLAEAKASLPASCFDAEDVAILELKERQTVERREALQASLDHKRSIYEQQVRGLEQQIQTRERSLDKLNNSTQLLQKFPDLLEYFTEKQVRLEAELRQIKRELLQES